jgi:glycosyltransferase involved in cell wall biosynthesis
MPQIMASADILFTILEPEAGIYSVPSKVQTYLCGNKPLLLSVPEDNLIARIVNDVNAGLIVPPNDVDSIISSVELLKKDKELRDNYGKNGRKYAEEFFNIDKIGYKFQEIIDNELKNKFDSLPIQ